MVYGDFNDLPKRTTSDKVLRVKHLILLKIQNMMDIKEVLLLCLFVNFSTKSCQVVKYVNPNKAGFFEKTFLCGGGGGGWGRGVVNLNPSLPL